MYIVGRHVSKRAHGQDLVLADVDDSIVLAGLVPGFLGTDRTEQQLLRYMAGMARHGYPKDVEEMRSMGKQASVGRVDGIVSVSKNW
ncbi:hypothetical protein PG994_007111 [Apiospora phragmitis]|uniref:Uncharacterized protein n=1 Tax=Apiospora phragmitis TaxID=2905665 RepID=A0ABR1V369_9PEZI